MEHDNQPLQIAEKLANGGTATWSSYTSSVRMTTDGTADGLVVRQSRKYLRYRAGQSVIVLATFNMGPVDVHEAGVTKRVGFFDDANGIILEVTPTDIAMVRRTSTSSSVVNNRVVQYDWNYDRFDGTGPSGVTLDFSKTQILVVDYQWLGVGRVRIGFDIDGEILPAHQFLNANRLTVPYMGKGTLPVRFEISDTGAGDGGDMDQICFSVLREGGQVFSGIQSCACTGIGGGLTATTTTRSLASFRLRQSHIRAQVRPLSALLSTHSSGLVWWGVFINPTLTGTLTWADFVTSQTLQRSLTQLDYVPGSGHLLASGYAEGTNQSASTETLLMDSLLGISADIDGNSDIMTVCVESSSGTLSVDCAMYIIEEF